MLLQNAAIHDDKDSGLAGFFRSFLVNHFLLHPDGRHFELNGLIDDRLNVFRTAEEVHDVNFLRHVKQRRVRCFSEAGLDLRIDGNDAVTVTLHVSGDAVAGTQRIVGESYDRDGFGALQQIGNGIGSR